MIRDASGSWLSIALLLVAAASHAAGKAAPGLIPGSPAPPFTLPDIHGKSVRLEEFRGQVVVLNFWAFWCDTWKAEMPHLQELAAQQQELGFRLIAISVDGTRLPEFQNRTRGGRTPFPVLVDVGGRVSVRYQVAHVPTVVVVDQDGRVRYRAIGYPGNQVVLSVVRKLTVRAPHRGAVDDSRPASAYEHRNGRC
jgi:peroxiredoxin